MDRTCNDLLYSVMWKCQWDSICKADVEVRCHVDSYSLEAVLSPRVTLYGGRCETFAIQ